MIKKITHLVERSYSQLFMGVADLLEQARQYCARSVKCHHDLDLLGGRAKNRGAEQQGKKRARHGEALIERLALDITAKFGRGFSQSNLWQMRDFYLGWPILQTASGELATRQSPY